jgi:hypothetical protein
MSTFALFSLTNLLIWNVFTIFAINRERNLKFVNYCRVVAAVNANKLTIVDFVRRQSYTIIFTVELYIPFICVFKHFH